MKNDLKNRDIFRIYEEVPVEEKKIEIKIPAGVDNGSKMRLSQEGDAGKNGGVAGDLYVVIHILQLIQLS